MNPVAELLQPEVQELIREKRFTELREALHLVAPADVADILAGLDPAETAAGFRVLQHDDAARVFSYLDSEKQEALIKALGAETTVAIVEEMRPDDRVRLLDELPAEVAQRIVASLSPEERKLTQAILGYPHGTVGRIMTPDYIRIRPDWTIAQALAEVRRQGRDAETINVLYVVDNEGRLIDDMRLRQVLLADPAQTVESLMTRSFISLKADQDQEQAVHAMARYDRIALPVVDSRGLLVGIVTADDVADVAEEETTEDIQKLGGMEALDDPYITVPILELVRKRITWLAALFIGEMATATAMSGFEEEIQRAAVLATFVPLIVSSGGNSGSQATSLIIRSLAIGELTLADWWRVMRRELACGALLGAGLGCIGIVRVNVWGWMGWFKKKAETGAGFTPESLLAQSHFELLGITIGVAVLGVVLWGTVIGSMLPFVLKRLHLDPATSSAPFVATLVDVVGVLIYFWTAVVILRGTLL
ncbi:MAG: magnesium transporter [Phycisphaerales bacterium]|nr:magnesium transporter [Phycisphaerales bacterium]